MPTPEHLIRLHARIEPRGPAAAIILTDEQVAVLGAGRTPAVRVTAHGISGTARVGRMGGENLVGFSKKLRAELGVEIGDLIDVVIDLNAEPPEIAVPPALARAFVGDPAAKAVFDALAPSHRKEFARWIDEAKRDQTTNARVEQTLQMLRDRRTRH